LWGAKTDDQYLTYCKGIHIGYHG